MARRRRRRRSLWPEWQPIEPKCNWEILKLLLTKHDVGPGHIYAHTILISVCVRLFACYYITAHISRSLLLVDCAAFFRKSHSKRRTSRVMCLSIRFSSRKTVSVTDGYSHDLALNGLCAHIKSVAITIIFHCGRAMNSERGERQREREKWPESEKYYTT